MQRFLTNHSSLIFLGILALALALRLTLTLPHANMLGVDGGAYFDGLWATLDKSYQAVGFPRPPLAPGYLLAPFYWLFGMDDGYKIWGSVASLCPLVAVYLLTRRILNPALALFAAAFAAVDLTHAEMIVTGALPLIAFGLLGLAWWAMLGLAERFSWREAAILTVCVGLIPWVNQTTAGIALVTLPFVFITLLHFRKGQRWAFIKRVLPFALMGGIIALGALPWYLQVLPGNGILNYPGPRVYLTGFDVAWGQLALAWLVGGLAVWKTTDYRVKTLGLVCILLGTLLVFLSYDETIINVFYRSRYLLAVAFYPLVTWLVLPPAMQWLRHSWQLSPKSAARVAIGSGILALGVMLAGYVTVFQTQTRLSDMATLETQQALELARLSRPNDAIISNSFTLSLWVAALNKVPSPNTFTTEPPAFYAAEYADVRCLMNWVDGCDAAQAAAQLRAGYILIDRRFPSYNPTAPGVWGAVDPHQPWDTLATAAWLRPVYQRGSTTLYAVEPPPMVVY